MTECVAKLKQGGIVRNMGDHHHLEKPAQDCLQAALAVIVLAILVLGALGVL